MPYNCVVCGHQSEQFKRKRNIHCISHLSFSLTLGNKKIFQKTKICKQINKIYLNIY